MAKAFLKKTPTGWIPADDDAVEVHRKHRLHDVLKAEIVKPRNWQSHKLFMTLLSLTYENLPEKLAQQWPTARTFRRAMAWEVGYVEEFANADGEIIRVPLSLSYDDLPDEVEFQRIASAMMSVCARILDMSEPELAAEVSRYADQSYGRAA